MNVRFNIQLECLFVSSTFNKYSLLRAISAVFYFTHNKDKKDGNFLSFLVANKLMTKKGKKLFSFSAFLFPCFGLSVLRHLPSPEKTNCVMDPSFFFFVVIFSLFSTNKSKKGNLRSDFYDRISIFMTVYGNKVTLTEKQDSFFFLSAIFMGIRENTK